MNTIPLKEKPMHYLIINFGMLSCRFSLGKTFLIGISLLFSACTSRHSESTVETKNQRPPNIVYILADDLGFGDLSCYGQKTLHTPNIDRLANEGMRFTQHYAGSTVCAPSRASFLTGKHAGHINVRGNSPPGQLIKDEEVTIADALKKVGYTSAIIGKWGVGHPPPPDDPQRNGFDYHFGYINMWHAHNFFPEFLYRDAQKKSLPGNVTDMSFDYSKNHPGGMPEGAGVAKEKKTYVLGEFENEAINFLENNRDRPFFLYLALNMPHANNEAGYYLGDGMEVPMIEQKGKYIPNYGAYAGMEWPNPEKGFAKMMHLIDQTVGVIDQKIKDLGLSEGTILLFSSDNGPHQEGGHKVDFFDSNGPLRGSKRDLYEGGIRVPLIVKWPGQIKAGSSSDHMSGFPDLLPTFCDVAGAEIPAGIDGFSLLPTLLGSAHHQRKHEFLYWEFYEQGGRQAVRKNNWKYIKLNVRDPNKPIVQELYDLSTDLSEQNNLVHKHPEIGHQMEKIMREAHQPTPIISLFAKNKDTETTFQ